MARTSPAMTKWEDRRVENLKDLIKGQDLIVAPVALNPIMAQMAAEAGF
jgi:2-methylisocitrate lyase-like PEP mutase family enzyme